MGKSIRIDTNAIYKAWRVYLLGKSKATHFGTVFDATKQAEFPYANLKLIGRPTNGSDLEGDEASVTLTYEAEGYINNNRYSVLYGIDDASADFFLELGFRRVGDSEIVRVSDTVTKITSRFTMAHYCGYFLKPLGSF